MPDMELWYRISRHILKAELKRNGVSNAELARRLTNMGIKENRFTVINKLRRGKFSTGFFLAALHAINSKLVKNCK